MGEVAEPRGWGWPMNSRKAHYFEAGRSLCGRWMFWGRDLLDDVARSPDDCAACWKALVKRGSP